MSELEIIETNWVSHAIWQARRIEPVPDRFTRPGSWKRYLVALDRELGYYFQQ